MYDEIASRVLKGTTPLSRSEARSLLQAPANDLLPILHAAYKVRHSYFGRRVHIHVLENAKLGACPEDCSFCSQSKHFSSPSGEAPHKTVQELVSGARAAAAVNAKRYCMVTATHGPSSRDLETICSAAKEIKSTLNIELCASLGFLTEDKAKKLKDAGIDRFNHNLETSENNFANVVSTHTFADRVKTVELAKKAGMETCCGGIVGLGETDDDIIDLAFALRDLDVDSMPVNFLDPRPGTPLADKPRLSPQKALLTLSMFRLAHPRADLRVAGGREVTLKELQPLALFPANSLFSAGYLTTSGATVSDDIQMIASLGFEVENAAGELPNLDTPNKLPVIPHGPN